MFNMHYHYNLSTSGFRAQSIGLTAFAVRILHTGPLFIVRLFCTWIQIYNGFRANYVHKYEENSHPSTSIFQ